MLDTNICIYLMQKQPEAVARRFAQCYVGDVVMSAITVAELEFGLAGCADPERVRQNLDAIIELIEVKPFDVGAARSYVTARKAKLDRTSDHFDKLFAAHAISLGATLVTNNDRGFVADPSLTFADWLKN